MSDCHAANNQHPPMTESAALALLAAHTSFDDPASWGAHSLCVSRVAGTLAEALRAAGARVDPALARSGGLLHDIGRSITHAPEHCLEGYRLLLGRGEPVLACFCITHGFGGLTPREAASLGWPVGDYRSHTWEEKAVTIADGLTHFDRAVYLSERVASLLTRYDGRVDAVT
jgi:putative nucleotidyltransferase with HDIG domain